MIAKTITYVNFNGDTETETFYFHINKAELATMELVEKEGLAERLRAIVESDDRKAILAAFTDIIAKSIGRRSSDGKRFSKSKEYTEEFMSSEAYSELFVELLSDTAKAEEFVKGIIPKNLNPSEKSPSETVDVPLPSKAPQLIQLPEVPSWILENRPPTETEFLTTPSHIMADYFRSKGTAISVNIQPSDS
jgi:hypothetical protein